MEYTTKLSPRAFADIDAIVEHIQADSPVNATRWRESLFAKIAKLSGMPHSCSLAPEDEYCSIEVRQTFLGRYRILFTVRQTNSLVYVLAIHHGARRFLPADELEDG